LLTVGSSILQMQCRGPMGSGTVLWSALLPTSRETGITHTEQGQGGGVRQVLPLRRRPGVRVFRSAGAQRLGARAL
jgi:hypothetical protein